MVKQKLEEEKEYVLQLFKVGKRAEAFEAYRSSSNAANPNISQEDFDAHYSRKVRGKIADKAWLIFNGPFGGALRWLGLSAVMLIILSLLPKA